MGQFFDRVDSTESAEKTLRQHLGRLKYFVDCRDQKEAKTRYRKLSLKHHPDKGGKAEIFDQIRQEYEKVSAIFAEHEALLLAMSQFPHLFNRTKKTTPAVQAADVVNRMRSELGKPENKKKIIESAGNLGDVLLKAFVGSMFEK